VVCRRRDQRGWIVCQCEKLLDFQPNSTRRGRGVEVGTPLKLAELHGRSIFKIFCLCFRQSTGLKDIECRNRQSLVNFLDLLLEIILGLPHGACNATNGTSRTSTSPSANKFRSTRTILFQIESRFAPALAGGLLDASRKRIAIFKVSPTCLPRNRHYRAKAPISGKGELPHVWTGRGTLASSFVRFGVARHVSEVLKPFCDMFRSTVLPRLIRQIIGCR